ncbi:hypothetical protein NQ318_000173 [Aromia moschata]|uniref:Uncharacterized protein n=1 Tax=Aromia moschata TaxID=1265417 RepID=A0AAV8YLH2_9CUCU|nr:hypothetical protein NQ318_000173 [Aromia moschata]
MSLPVSQYEALLAEVRGLRQKAQRVQQLARPLLQGDPAPPPPPETSSRLRRPRSPAFSHVQEATPIVSFLFRM